MLLIPLEMTDDKTNPLIFTQNGHLYDRSSSSVDPIRIPGISESFHPATASLLPAAPCLLSKCPVTHREITPRKYI